MIVTTYDTLISDFDVIGDIPWRVTVVDEAHRLRNVKGKLLECMKELSAKGTMKFGYQSRVLMTGTPLQNNTQGEPWPSHSLPSLFTDITDILHRIIHRIMDALKLHRASPFPIS